MKPINENIDQVTLRLWITEGLRIEGVRSLHGDSAYLLNNMIAKYSLATDEYRISSSAQRKLIEIGIDFNMTHSRSKFYGKISPFIYEHPIPVSIIRNQLLQSNRDDATIKKILNEGGQVTVLLREEDESLNRLHLKSKMPNGWSWGSSIYARYDAAGIQLSSLCLKVNGKIKR